MLVSKWGDSLAYACRMRWSRRWACAPATNSNIVDVVERTLVVKKQDRRKAALERLAALNWTLPPDYKFDRDEANER